MPPSPFICVLRRDFNYQAHPSAEHRQTRAPKSILVPGFTVRDCCIHLAWKLLHHQMILQPSAIPARFSFPMDPPASAFQTQRAPRAKAKEHGGMCAPAPYLPAPHSLPPNIPGLNQFLLLILPPKTAWKSSSPERANES